MDEGQNVADGRGSFRGGKKRAPCGGQHYLDGLKDVQLTMTSTILS
jgi:hypothetical protein